MSLPSLALAMGARCSLYTSSGGIEYEFVNSTTRKLAITINATFISWKLVWMKSLIFALKISSKNTCSTSIDKLYAFFRYLLCGIEKLIVH